MNTATDRKAGRAPDPLTWQMKLAASIVGAFVLAVAAVIALVVVSAQVGFYDTHLGTKRISFNALGVDTPVDLPTFTPLATEGVVWAFTLLAVILVIANRTATIWTQSMWVFATIAAVVNTWYSIGDEHDLFGGAIRGGLSLAGPYLVHMFILWCRHLRSGKTLDQARADMEIKWQGIVRKVAAILFVLLCHLRHPNIARRAFGYWTGVHGWGYRTAWQAASIDYRNRIQATLNTAAVKTPGCAPATAGSDTPAVEFEAADASTPPQSGSADETLAAGAVATVERPAFSTAEIDDLIAQMNGPSAAWDIWADQQGQAADGHAQRAAETDGDRRPGGREQAAGERPKPVTKTDEIDTTSGRRPRPRTLRPRGVKRTKRPVAGASQAADVDVSDILPAARRVAAGLGDKLSRDALIEGLRGAGVSVGGRRKKAVYDAVRAEREAGSTGE